MARKNSVLKGFLVLWFLCAVFTHVTAPVFANQQELSVTRATALAALDEAFEKVSENAEAFEGYIDLIAEYLPEDSITILSAVVSVAQLDVSTEEKIDTIVEVSQSGCTLFVLIWFIFLLLGWFLPLLVLPLPNLSLLISFIAILRDIGFWAWVLCVLGII